MISKTTRKRIIKVFVKVVLSKPKFHIWTSEILVSDINKLLPPSRRITPKELGYYIKTNNAFRVFKHSGSRSGITKYIFVKITNGRKKVKK